MVCVRVFGAHTRVLGMSLWVFNTMLVEVHPRKRAGEQEGAFTLYIFHCLWFYDDHLLSW